MLRLPPATRLRAHLKRGGLIAYPTEYCYGLGGDPTNARALRRVLQLKKRPQHKGLIVIGTTLPQLQPLLQPLSEIEQSHLRHIWPAAKTYVLPARNTILPQLRGQRRNRLAVRIPDHQGARQLCQQARMPLISTSCNKAGIRPCKTAREAKRIFGRQVWVLQGKVGGRRRPSEIIDWQDKQVLR